MTTVGVIGDRSREQPTACRGLAVLNISFGHVISSFASYNKWTHNKWTQCCPGKVAPSDGKSRPFNVLWPVLPGNDLKSRGRKWSPERSIRTRHNEG